jgi:hypothetical protein
MLPKAAVEKFLQGLSEPIKLEMRKHVDDIYKELNAELRKVQAMQGELRIAIDALAQQHKENEERWDLSKSS